MDADFVAMLVLGSGLQDLPPHLAKFAGDPEWWATLEETEPADLTAEQRAMIKALGASVPEE